MQTFLPYPSFSGSAQVLDQKRCWKQVVEAAQILDVLEGRKTGWANHPAVKMWEGHIPELRWYFNDFLVIAVHKHKINTKYDLLGFDDIENRRRVHDSIIVEMPWWHANKKFHRAMRARLIEKDREFYLPLFPEDEGYNGGKYFWPNMETQTFYII